MTSQARTTQRLVLPPFLATRSKCTLGPFVMSLPVSLRQGISCLAFCMCLLACTGLLMIYPFGGDYTWSVMCAALTHALHFLTH